MKKVATILFLTVLGGFLSAQNSIMFNKVYPMDTITNGYATDVLSCPGGYIVYGGVNDSISPYYFRFYIMKTDSFGNRVWVKSYGKREYNYDYFLPDAGGSLAKVPWGGGYIGTGYIADSSNSWYKALLIRFDNNGDTLWTKTFTDTITNELLGWFIKPGKNHKYIIGCAQANYNVITYQYRIVLIETDSNGKKLWGKIYNTISPTYQQLMGIDTCKDGGFILSEMQYDSTYRCGRQIVITKVDSLGNVQWSRTIPNPECNNFPGGVASLKDGGFVICGSWDTKNPLVYPMLEDPVMFMRKYSATGNQVWSREYSLTGGISLAIPIELSNGDILACGSGGGDSINFAYQGGAILKTDSNGNQKWLRYYEKFYSNYPYPEPEYLVNIKPTHDGGYVSCGYTYGKYTYSWVVKVDSNGCDTIGCKDTLGVTGIAEVRENSNKITLYPNPNNGKFTVSLQNVSEKTQIFVYNILGEQVYQSSLNETNTQIDLSNKAEGLYLYRVITVTGELVGEGKFVIEK